MDVLVGLVGDDIPPGRVGQGIRIENPADRLKAIIKILKEAIAYNGPSLVEFFSACPTGQVTHDWAGPLISGLRKFGVRAFFGDPSRPDLLLAAGIRDARTRVANADLDPAA